MKTIGILIPLYNEQDCINAFYAKLVEIIDPLPYIFTIIFIDDGSNDTSNLIINNLSVLDKRIKIISLVKNFGKDIALFAGINNSTFYDAIIMIDADLQDPVTLLPKLITTWKKGFFVVRTSYTNTEYAYQSITRIYLRFLFYTIFTLFAKIEKYSHDYCLIDRRVVKNISNYKGYPIFIRSIISNATDNYSVIKYKKRVRYAGQTKYYYINWLKFFIISFCAYTKISNIIGLFYKFNINNTIKYNA